MSASKKKNKKKVNNTKENNIAHKNIEEKAKEKEVIAQNDISKEDIKSENKLPEIKEEHVDKKESTPKSEDVETLKNTSENKEEQELKEIVDKKETKELTRIEETPEYVKEMLKNKKRKTIIFICIVIIIILLIATSTFFALFNIKNINIITGVKIKDIDISGLSIEDSKNKLQKALDDELLAEIKLKYNNEYEITLAPSQIEFKYDIDTAINNAYTIGRNGNILENNYEILYSSFFGKNEEISYSYKEEFLDAFIDDISSKIPGVVVNPSYYIEDKKLIINQGIDGISVEKEELKDKILKAILNRKYANIEKDDYNKPIEIPTKKTKAPQIDIEKIYSEVKREPQDAHFELEPYQIFPDLDGIDFDIEKAKEEIKEYKEEYSIPLIITKAAKSIDDLGTEAFPYLISSFSTKYDASNINRSTNLAIATNKINGKVLMPGEVFSFNKIVGKRTVEEGYRDAKIYADGGVVDGLAGGICQISSTLYNAVLLANLEIVERKNHSYPTSYVSVGRDATVVYGAIDFQFKNSRKYPIKIEASVKNGIAEFKIHGMQEENEYEIKIIPITTSSIPYATQYVPTPTLAPGQQLISQSGHAGYKVTTYIEKRLEGALVSKEVLSNDTYSPMKTIILTGPEVPIQ